MDRRPENSPSPAEAAALRLAHARRCYQAVLNSWTHDLLLLRARGLLSPGPSAPHSVSHNQSFRRPSSVLPAR